MVILDILINNILPIFLLIGLGFLLEKKFTLQMNTLTKINFYVFVPAFMFVNLYETDLDTDAWKVLFIDILLLGCLFIISTALARIRKYDDSRRFSFQNAVMFYNSGNIGIPLVTLVFSTGRFLNGDGQTPFLAMALSYQVMTHMVQSVGINTIGFINAGRANSSTRRAILNVFKMPTIYTVPVAFLLKSIRLDITGWPVWPVLTYARNALVPIALLSLGVQLAKSKIQVRSRSVLLAVATRLIGGPLLAFIFIHLFRLDGLVAQVLFISASVPTAVNTALIAVEKNNHPDFATQIVVLSTLLSLITMTAVIFLADILFPVF